jgi:ElaB/YqjD/DUF883 family membrane-anchored ribosome-binding protein
MSQSVDAMLGIINNANQTATIIDSQRNISDSLRAATERNINTLMQGITSESRNTDNIISMNNAFANQNLATVGSSLKDLIQSSANLQLSATERNGSAAISATDRVGTALSHSLERIGADNINATDRNGAAGLIATERNGSAGLLTTERIGNNLSSLLNINNNLLNSSIKESQVTSERNFGESRLFNATLNNNLERKVGEYYNQSERSIHSINNDLLKVENSLGRVMDNHYNSGMMELLKVHSSIDKSINHSENNLMRQASDNYANIQIEAAKNKLGLEQKLTELKLDIIKDNNDTRNLINSYNNDNIRNDLQTERVIHALHHHHPYHHHDRHHHDRHHDRHHHHYPPFFPYSLPLQQSQQSPRN